MGSTGASIPAPAFTALAQWVLKVGGHPRLNVALAAGRGGAAEDTDRLLADLASLARTFAERMNTLEPRYDGPIYEAYDALGLHALSDWEVTEVAIERDVANGRYDAWSSAKKGAVLFDKDLLYLVVHGHFDKARPLLLRYADEEPGSIASFWFRWIATNRIDVAEAHRLAAQTLPWRLPLAFVDGDARRAEALLASETRPKERELSMKPVKSLPKLLAQLIAFWRGEVAPSVLERSFHNWFATSYHYESPSDLWDKIGPAYLYGRALHPERAAHELVAGIKTHLPMFSPARRAKRAVHVADVAPVMSALAAVRDVVARRNGLTIRRTDDEVVLAAEPSAPERDFF